MLTRANVTKDETILVTGASGGVGSATVQLAQARGANVIAVTSASKAKALMELGALRTIDCSDDFVSEIGAGTVDVIIDLVAGSKWQSLLDLLRPGGRYAVAGAIGGPIVELDIRTLYLKDLSFFGCTVLEPQVFGKLIGRIERKEIAPLVAETYPLREIAAAQEVFGEKGYIGKIVLKLN
jgi:NADPH:quinone reductase-like Zn-dependent oxidoreductase